MPKTSRLLENIGWNEDEGSEGVHLTMPRHDLMELLQRLHDEAAKVLIERGTEAAARRADAETNQRFQLGYEACERVLADLDPRIG